MPLYERVRKRIYYREHIWRADLRRNPDCLFLFGDNFARVGLGGQAKEMRGEPNAVGIVTKKRPSMDADAFFSDADYPLFHALLRPVDQQLTRHLRNGGFVVCPAAGVGTDRASLPKCAPRCFALLKSFFASHGIYPPHWQRHQERV